MGQFRKRERLQWPNANATVLVGGSLLEPRAEFWAKCLALGVGLLTWGFRFRPFSAPDL